MLGDIRRFLGWIELDFHVYYVHPLNWVRNSFCAPKKMASGRLGCACCNGRVWQWRDSCDAGASRKPSFLTVVTVRTKIAVSRAFRPLKTVLDCNLSKCEVSDGF
jgi:hypothetical protein